MSAEQIKKFIDRLDKLFGEAATRPTVASAVIWPRAPRTKEMAAARKRLVDSGAAGASV